MRLDAGHALRIDTGEACHANSPLPLRKEELGMHGCGTTVGIDASRGRYALHLLRRP